MGAIKEVVVPDIGDFNDVPIIEVMVKPGDTVKPEDSLITLESDKATMEVPAPFGGVVKEIKVKLGDKVSQGSLILTLEAAGEAAAGPAARTETAPPPAPPAQPQTAPAPAAGRSVSALLGAAGAGRGGDASSGAADRGGVSTVDAVAPPAATAAHADVRG